MNNINTEACTKTHFRKETFIIKPPTREGLILKINHTIYTKTKPQNIRFLHAAFNVTGELLAAINHYGQIFVIDLKLNKFWFVETIKDFSTLKFCQNENEFLIGTHKGVIYLLNTELGYVTSLKEHVYPILDFTFSSKNICISFSEKEAIIWDLNEQKQLQHLKLEREAVLKLVQFVPVSDHILACFQDDVIQIWNLENLQPLKQLLPSAFHNISVKTIAFTLDGRAMVVGGSSPNLVVFIVEVWATVQTITLPDNIQSIKKLQFISHPFDGGCNKIVAILASNGTILFYNMETDCIVNKIFNETEIMKFALCPRGKLIACLGKDGEIQLYTAEQMKENIRKGKKYVLSKKPFLIAKRDQSKIINEQIKDILDINKLKGILKGFGEYPELYRKTIWAAILHLPNSQDLYDTITSMTYASPFDDLEKKFPIENLQELRNLKRILTNIVVWCPYFATVSYLPHFVYPFVRFFQNEPILCFEAVIVILVNFCQFWFEYHPLLPLNILGIIENMLLEHDPELLTHFNKNDVTPKIYAWSLLQTAFSEVLQKCHWLIFWDHVLSNEPAFLLVAVVSYNLYQRQTLLAFTEYADFSAFYCGQNPIDFRNFLTKTYNLLKNTSKENHPRQYLENFEGIGSTYPQFKGFPKCSEAYSDNIQDLGTRKKILELDEKLLLLKKSEEIEKLKTLKKNSEELCRQSELQNIYERKLDEERKEVEDQRERLLKVQNFVNKNEQGNALEKTKETDMSTLNLILTKAENLKSIDKKLLGLYRNLWAHRQQIECSLKGNESTDINSYQEYIHLAGIVKKVQKSRNSTTFLKEMLLAFGIETMDNVISKFESQVLSNPKSHSSNFTVKVNILASETNKLSNEITNLIHLLSMSK